MSDKDQHLQNEEEREAENPTPLEEQDVLDAPETGQEIEKEIGKETEETPLERPEEVTEEVTEKVAGKETAPEESVAEEPSTVAKQDTPARRGGGFIGGLALLLVILLAGAGGWVYLVLLPAQVEDRVQRSLATQLPPAPDLKPLENRIAQLEARPLAPTGDFVEAAELRSLSRQLQQGLDSRVDPLAQQLSRQQQLVRGIQQSLQSADLPVEPAVNPDREKWLMAEAEYLLRLANQRLIMTGDVRAAEALLGSADNVLREIDDIAFHSVRATVTRDIAALRALPRIDTEGIYLRLDALAQQTDELRVFRMPEKTAAPAEDSGEGWRARLSEGYQAALAKLSSYIVIRRREAPYEVLMDPQWESLVRQNLRMLIQQAQGALLMSRQVLYSETLERAGQWVAEFYGADERAAKALAEELANLKEEVIEIALPDISASIHALDKVVQQRTGQ